MINGVQTEGAANVIRTLAAPSFSFSLSVTFPFSGSYGFRIRVHHKCALLRRDRDDYSAHPD